MKLFPLICFFLISLGVSAQEFKPLTVPYEEIPLQADAFLGYDKFGYLYFTYNNVLVKQKGPENFEYKNLSLGKITRVDLLNPLKIVLLYEAFNTIITLDNQLNETQRIHFSENPAPIVVTAAGIASQNRLWIFNSLTQELGLYDYLKNTLQPLATPFQQPIASYASDFNHFQWIDANYNWYRCDVFGKVSFQGKVASFDQIQFLNGNSFLYTKDQRLYITDVNSGQQYWIENIDKSFESFYYKDQILSIFTRKGITNYKINIP